jgi:glycosyltransferase involved in cell wall biosynthesis
MRVWLIVTGEPLPSESSRPHRIGILAKLMADLGHEVTWWASAFDHQTKTFISNQDKTISHSPRQDIVLMHTSVGYARNLSLQRIRNHQLVARKFEQLAEMATLPDVIFCCFPTIELSQAAVQFGARHGIPTIIDVRDLWPDIFVTPFPTFLRPLIHGLIHGLRKQTRAIFSQCTAVTAISSQYLQWALNYGSRKVPPPTGIFPLSYERHPLTDLERDTCDERLTAMGIDPGRTIIWFVGTFGQTYDLDVVIHAARALSKVRSDLQFVFSGEGERGPGWQTMAAGLGNVIFTGWIDKTGLASLSQKAAIGLLAYSPDAPQGLPNKIFEYMSAGIPMLSSLQGEAKDLLEQHRIGYSYGSGQGQGFLEKLLLIVDDPAGAKAMGVRAKQVFQEHFAPETVYPALIQFIETIAEQHRPAATSPS